KSLYIVSPISLGNYPTPCPINARCIMPLIWRVPDNFSMIHKYTLNEGKPFYSDTAVVKGDLLNQYSMDEDDKGNFRILTRNRNPQLATHVWKLNSSLQHDSQLLNIEPGEDFKASRYIGDKLYLVTFQQIDPLFVIDMATKPTILGELKIPGFSQYLHPYSPLTNGKQLLIGLGVDTQEKDGRVTTNGLKLDLYEINYNQKDANGSISIKQLHTKTIGGKGSWSESLENPRTFVYNEKTKKLLLPMIAQDEIEKKTCQKDYYGQEYCYPTMSYNTTFAGLKTFMLDTTSGITELASKDYKDQIISYLKANNQYYGSEWNNFGLDQRQYMGLGNRAGYIGDTSYFINNAFADFITSKETKMIKF
ncbi:MAG TPA: beta-propeller domain-containing protein, partial [Candidatus Absconditabacterales bacterium]|nr:beta-propeller domain-containing protein [Candidatus Absconditabacterales bacterium]